MTRGLRAGLLFAASLVLASPAALADAHSQAVGKFKAAQQLYDRGQFEAAQKLFKESDAVLHTPNTMLYVARCARELGDLPAAYELMSATVRAANDAAAKDAKYAATRDAAAAELAVLEMKVGRVVVAVAEPPDGLALTLNGAPLDNAKIGSEMAVKPGHVVVVATAPNKPDQREEVDVPAGAQKTIAIAFVAKKVAPLAGSEGPSEQASASPAAKAASPVRTAGFFVAGLGVAGFATFAVAGAVSSSHFSKVESACGSGPCKDDSLTGTIKSGKTLDTVANIGLVVGGVGLGAGALMIAFGGPKKAAAEKTDDKPAEGGEPTALVFGASPAGGSFALRGSF